MPRSAVDVPVMREAPADLLAQLREIDATAELVYVGEGEWWLGALSWNVVRWHTGTRLWAYELRRDVPRLEHLRYARLMVLGFGWCRGMSFQGEPTSALVTWFREADYLWRTQRTAFERRIEHQVTEPPVSPTVRSLVKHALNADGRHAFRYFVKGQRKIIVHG